MVSIDAIAKWKVIDIGRFLQHFQKYFSSDSKNFFLRWNLFKFVLKCAHWSPLSNEPKTIEIVRVVQKLSTKRCRGGHYITRMCHLRSPSRSVTPVFSCFSLQAAPLFRAPWGNGETELPCFLLRCWCLVALVRAAQADRDAPRAPGETPEQETSKFRFSHISNNSWWF